jgi:DNA-binding transcriptional ArsR family regulator
MVQYQQDICRVFHALGDPTRFAMLQEISKGEVAASDLANPRRITLTATLKHLRILDEAGLTETFKVGRERRCRMRVEALNEAERWMQETRRVWNFRLDQLDKVLAEMREKP